VLAATVGKVLAAANVSRPPGWKENCYARNARGFSGFSLYINGLAPTPSVVFSSSLPANQRLTLCRLTLREYTSVVTKPDELVVLFDADDCSCWWAALLPLFIDPGGTQ